MGRWKGEVFKSRECDSNPPRWLMGRMCGDGAEAEGRPFWASHHIVWVPVVEATLTELGRLGGPAGAGVP